MKNFVKKSVAIIQIIAMSIALSAGINFATTAEVKAAEGELIVNQETYVVADKDEKITYIFVAPEDGTYYFTTMGDSITYGELYIDGKLCEQSNTGGISCNFLIKQQLKKGESCSVLVKASGRQGLADAPSVLDYNLVVYDYSHASKIVNGFTTADGKFSYDCNIGDSITFNIVHKNLAGEKMNIAIDLNEYSFKWKKMVYSLELTHEYTVFNLEKGPSFTIDKIAANDFYYSRDDGTVTEYWVEISRNGELIQMIDFSLFEKERQNEDIKLSPGRAKIIRTTPKKKSDKKVRITLKKINGAKGYQVAVYTTKKNAKNNKKALIKKNVQKINVTITSKKLKNKKALFVKARAYVFDGKTKVYGKWSAMKKVKIK